MFKAAGEKYALLLQLNGIPVPALSSALSYYDGYRCANLPANLLQAQRDYFGAHTYERSTNQGASFTIRTGLAKAVQQPLLHMLYSCN